MLWLSLKLYANTVWGQNKNPTNLLITLQKISLDYEFWMEKCISGSCFFKHKMIKPPDKILLEIYIFISKSISFNVLSTFNHWFILTFENTKKYD